jgi:hypothetical protein
VRSTDAGPGDTLPDIARAIERTNGWTR